MSAPASTVVTPTGSAAVATPMKGGMMLSPASVQGGRRRKSRRMSKKAKKALKMLKKMGGDELEEAVAPVTAGAEEMAPVEGARRRKSRRGSRKSRKSRKGGLFY